MSEIANDTEEQRIVATQLTAQAEEWESIATQADSLTERAASERASWDGRYKPRDPHAEKMSELSTGTTTAASQARHIATALRGLASAIAGHAGDVDTTEAGNAADINAIDIDLGSGGAGGSTPPATGPDSGGTFEV